MPIDRNNSRARRKRRIRKKVAGTADRPRLTVFRSSKHIYAQVVDDVTSKPITGRSTLSKALASELTDKDKSARAAVVGKAIAEACKQKGITKVVFDRNGYAYHGRVKTLADSAREAGLEF
jgi:large subunit ribosomal protein L18